VAFLFYKYLFVFDGDLNAFNTKTEPLKRICLS